MEDDGFVLVEEDVWVSIRERVYNRIFGVSVPKKFEYLEPVENTEYLKDIDNMEPILTPPLVQVKVYEPVDKKHRGKTIDKCRRELLRKHKKKF